jgi:hypothetical protein
MAENSDLNIYLQVSTANSQFANAEVGCMPSSADPHRSQLLSPLRRRRVDFAMAVAASQSAAAAVWIGCDDSNDDGVWTDR